MKDLISREALREDFYELEIHGTMAVKAVLPIIEERIDSIPAADAVEVVHGRWKQCFEDWRKQIEGDKCSVCGFEHYGTSIRNYNYCPNCGARMDGE